VSRGDSPWPPVVRSPIGPPWWWGSLRATNRRPLDWCSSRSRSSTSSGRGEQPGCREPAATPSSRTRVFVPDALTVLGPVPAVPAPPPAAISLGATLSHLAPLLGAADAAVTEFREVFAGDRAPSRTTYARLVDSPLARQRFARAERGVQKALRDSLRITDVIDEAGPGFAPDAAVRTGMRLDLAEAATACRAALENLLDLRGAGGFLLDQRLQRQWRDIAVGTRYTGFNPYIAEEDYASAALNVGSAISLV
jgi:hypothetical protein